MIPISELSWKEERWSKGNGDKLMVYSKWLYQPHGGIYFFYFDIRSPPHYRFRLAQYSTISKLTRKNSSIYLFIYNNGEAYGHPSTQFILWGTIQWFIPYTQEYYTIIYIYIYIKLASMAQQHTHKWGLEFQPGSGDIGSLGYVPY